MSAAAVSSLAEDPFDVSRAELYAEDRWQAPFRRLRAEAPVHFVEHSKFGPYWSVSTYQPIVDIELDTANFSSSWEYGGITLGPPLEDFEMPMFIAMDEPRHSEQRKAVQPAVPIVLDAEMTAGGLHRFHAIVQVRKELPAHEGLQRNAILASFGELAAWMRTLPRAFPEAPATDGYFERLGTAMETWCELFAGTDERPPGS